jgi:hypothetical protein
MRHGHLQILSADPFQPAIQSIEEASNPLSYKDRLPARQEA